MRQIRFFATEPDLLLMLELVDCQGPFQYVRTGNFTKSEIEVGIEVYGAGAELPDLGKADSDSGIVCAAFLVCPRETQVNLRTVGSNDERICIDQQANDDSVVFTPAGIWRDGTTVLYGTVGTASDSEASKLLMKRFQAAIRKIFTKIKAYHVGPEARELLKNGSRLTLAVQTPREFDLSLT